MSVLRVRRGISYQHRKGEESEENIGITVSMDWTYMNSAENEDDESGPPTLVVNDNNTSAIWSMDRKQGSCR